MTRKPNSAPRAAKTRPVKSVRSNGGSVRSISSVMQKVQDLLPARKPALHMELATGLSVSYCEKLLGGQRGETSATHEALLRSEMGREVLFAIMGDDPVRWPQWFVKYRRQLDVYAAQKQLAENTRAIEALQAEMAK